MLIAIVGPFLLWLVRYINLDFWYDEVFTLREFVFVPILKTATDYFYPNNHVFFNLLNNIYLKVIGVGDLYSLLDGAWRIRLLPLVYTLFILVYLYLIGRKFFNKFVAKMSLIVLVTTIPFYNFSLQVRGYGLSMLLVCMLLYHAWSYEAKPSIFDALLIVLSAALSLYTIPLNLYFLVAIITIYVVLGIGKWKRGLSTEGCADVTNEHEDISQRQKLLGKHRDFVIVLLIGIGIVLALLLYLPIIKQVLHNRFVESHGLFYAPVLFEILPKVAYYFMSGRYLVLAAFIIGWFAYAIYGEKKESRIIGKAACCMAVLLLPFFFSFVRGGHPFLRVFVNLTPIFALLMSIGIYLLQASIPALRRRPLLLMIFAIVYCNITFAAAIRAIDRHIEADLKTGRKSQDIYYNYYQSHYHPMQLARDIANGLGPEPWEKLVVYSSDEAMPYYLSKFAVGFVIDGHNLESLLNSRERVYVVTALPAQFTDMMSSKYPHVECRRLNRRLQYHDLFILTRTPAQ